MADQPNEDDLQIDSDRKVKIRIGTLQDVLGILALSEAASIPRREATAAREEIGRVLARAIHPSSSSDEAED